MNKITKMSKYKQAIDGEWQTPIQKGYKIACCDCGLVHTIDFTVIKGDVYFRATRDKRATAQKRRHNNIKIELLK